MSYAMLAQLLIQFGPAAFDLAQKLIAKWGSSEPVTLAEIEELRKLGRPSARDQAIAALNRAGISVDSPQAQAVLALIPA